MWRSEALGDPPGVAAPGRPSPGQREGRSWRLLVLLGVVGPLGYLVLVTVLGLLSNRCRVALPQLPALLARHQPHPAA